MVKPAAKREAADYLHQKYEQSFRRTCRLLNIPRSSFYYKAKPRDDSELRRHLKEAAAKYRRWGYRMLTMFLRHQGFVDNHKRVYRVYREEGLQMHQLG